MADRELLVRILGDDRQLQQTLTRTERDLGGVQKRTAAIGSSLRAGFAAAGVVIGAQQVIGALEDSVDAASNLNEQISKSRAVFGDASAGLETWARGTASSIGIATDAALEATGTFGNLFATVGLGEGQAAGMSRRLVELAADLASFNNASPEDALEAIRSGLIGEAEPLRRFGVLLSETRVQQQAMSDTGKRSAQSLTDQEKALARYEIILRDTAPAQGDFARTSGGLANQQRILAANLRNLEANIGGILIPFLVRATTITNDLTEAFGRLGEVKIFGQGLPSLVGWVGGWKEIEFLIDHSAFRADDLKKTIEATDFSKLQPGTLPSGTGLGFPVLPVLPPAKAPPGPKQPPDPFAQLNEQQAEARRRGLAAQRALRGAQRRFGALVAGLGLKLENAQITKSLDDDLAVLHEIEAAILRQIAREGRTFKLANDLADVRARIATATADKVAASAQAARDAFAGIVASIDLRIDRAEFSGNIAAQIAALEELNRQITAEIAVEGRTSELLAQQQETRQRLIEARRTQTQQRQFAALGLSPEGAERVPGAGTLRRRGAALSDAIKGTALDTPKTRGQLRRISRVLSGEFGKVGEDVRSAIKGMFDKIAQALNDGSKKTGKQQQTAFRVVNTSNVLAGLGLSVEEQRALRRRLSRLGPGGTTPAPSGPGGAFGFSVQGGTVINGNVTVIADNPEQFGRQLQKKSRRTTHARTGPNSGRGM